MNKYRNKKIKANGIVYDSKKEYRRHEELKQMQAAGLIKNLRLQVKFELIPAQYEVIGTTRRGTVKRRCLEREITYIADFVYFDIKENKTIVEDTKSAITRKNPLYVVKRKLMLYVHGIRIVEV